MSWWGKIAGGGLGFAIGGPLGAMLGAVLGHQVDKANKNNFDPGSQERTQVAFFTATFSVMGHLAKADGQVSPQEIQMAEQVFRQMKFDPSQRSAAIELFNEGKKDDFNLDEVLDQFRRECGRKISLINMFLQIQIQAAYADGKKDPAEEKILIRICNRLGYPVAILEQLEALLFAQQRQYSNTSYQQPTQSDLVNAYKLLGVEENVTNDEVKKAYRRLMHQNHPDKLISKGLPEEMIQVATEKSKHIQKAYDLIKKKRGFT
ncbi:MAG: co-chaperone DjlA [Pseudomonadota bacterium]